MEITQHSLEYVKRQAKRVKKEQGITHTAALELVASEYGFANWIHCQRVLSQQTIARNVPVAPKVELSFTEWLKKHKNRNSPLGDLSRDAISDNTWPLYEKLENYQQYLRFKHASYDALDTLDRAWKTYKAYLRRKNNPTKNKTSVKKQKSTKNKSRKIVFVKNVKPIHYSDRTIETFSPGSPAWISWDGRKAIPVTILEVDDRHYTFKIERPLKKAGEEHYLFKDEVRSTPELACSNHVTL